jgi:pteridine reductase
VNDASTSHAAGAPVALVTGSGAPRIGNVVVRTLAARGYRVVIHANSSLTAAQATAAELTARGTEALAVAADLRDERAIDDMVRRAQEKFGRIDALVNCAAIWQPKPLEEVMADDVRQNFEINTLATFLCCQKVGLLMVRQPGGGAIVNFGDWAIARPYLNYAAYFPSKGAIPTLTRTFAAELASRNPRVRVNAIMPGPVMLPDDLSADDRASAIAGTLLRREGRPENVADAVVFLLENDYITGVCLPVDGGRTIHGIA